MALTESQIAMWETVVALVHADGMVHTEENKFLQERFEKLDISVEQKANLLAHIDNPGNPKELFKKITDSKDRAQLIYLARLLFYSDDDFSAEEDKILKLLHSEVMSEVDMKAAIHKMNQIAVDFQKKEQTRKGAQPIHRKIINAIVFWNDLDTADTL